MRVILFKPHSDIIWLLSEPFNVGWLPICTKWHIKHSSKNGFSLHFALHYLFTPQWHLPACSKHLCPVVVQNILSQLNLMITPYCGYYFSNFSSKEAKVGEMEYVSSVIVTWERLPANPILKLLLGWVCWPRNSSSSIWGYVGGCLFGLLGLQASKTALFPPLWFCHKHALHTQRHGYTQAHTGIYTGTHKHIQHVHDFR